ncbi:MAG: glycosyltransferase [Candidatus Eremiobacteraeota bacterium]|nr:glycosyltransferase [Candidatus Eremiobacteraeota bacterium]MBC5823933.1 glycosyltransferase [Candidatus Eremiobacteraeota bacterium]
MVAERASINLIRLLADVVIAGSASVRRELSARGFRKAMVVTTNGVDHLPYTNATTLEYQSRSGAVFIGRLHPSKNVSDAILAWQNVSREFPDQRLTIIGADAVPSYALELRQLISELNLTAHVQIAGVVSQSEKLRYLEHSKLFLFPSGEEGWGIALAEAMRAALPCLTYDLPIFTEIFPVGRVVVPMHDYVALAERAKELLRDESHRLRYAREALRLGKQFTWSRAAKIEAGVLNSLLGKKTRPIRGFLPAVARTGEEIL